ncbi:LuxR family transcriptional regulator [Bradyrhizobium sp. CCBAU 51753]|uniref:LuxR family transcriptional regulator n=1 Tax=Bradyrhizobium sp. CCBAU 51753 TaxID=1325100 RepID=UPI00188AAB70|nr:LuxR family transcriptional regulator [Bradyrhizobium sp. CCBAU 51753]QOZ23815.1 hypothetical protein XH93_09435 [Bradyrhizobium sp. CCBAU 51753]
MVANVDDFIAATFSINSNTELLDLFLKAVEAEGYQNAVFAKARNNRLDSIPWDRFPTGYLDTYREREWDRIDPVVQHIQHATRPFSWDELCARTNLDRKQKVFLQECRELGVHSGITIPLHGPGGNVDLISLSLRDQRKPNPDTLGRIYGVAVQYRLKLGELQAKPELPALHLTGREVECLRWCKEGKTNWEIGEIIATSEKTVEFHLSNAIRKLGACNRITAVVMAIQNGVISL